MSGAYGGMYGGEEKCIQHYGWVDYVEDRYKWENSFKMDIKWDGKP
jgi:hypothetical protein